MILAKAFVSIILAIASGACAEQPLSATALENALQAPQRTAADQAADASRKPLKLLRFLALRPGDVAAEINAGAGYNARLLPGAVGNEGRVYVTNATFVLELFPDIDAKLRASLANVPNVEVINQANTELNLPKLVDVAMLNNNYHDLHWQNIDTAAFNRSVYNAIRPGGYFVVGDHHAKSGSGTRDVATLHRIDAAHVIAEIESAGFQLVDEATFLQNSMDERTVLVLDPLIRGKTDRFLLKFQRPR